MSKLNLAGVGMTSQRTRDRLIQRLSDQGIINYEVLDVMRTTPRHLFLDEALDIISNEFNNDIIRIVNVMTKHFTNIVPHILDALIQKEEEKDLSEYSKIRSRHSFSTISTKVAEYKNLIEEIKMLN